MEQGVFASGSVDHLLPSAVLGNSMGCFPSKDQTENSQLVGRLSDRDAYASLSAILQRSENKSVLSVARSEASARWHSFPTSHFSLRYGAVSQRGHYPEAPNKDNQDRWCVHVPYGGSAEQALFGVFDGHGDFGSQCAAFAAHAVRWSSFAKCMGCAM